MQCDVIITLEGGFIQDVQLPIGIRLIVRDYDVEGVPEDELQRDGNGRPYVEAIWPAEPN